MKKLLIVNAGSSSMKFRVYEKDTLRILADGIFERIGIDGNFKMEFGSEEIELQSKFNNHLDATEMMLKELKKKNIIESENEIVGIGHRVVQGGERFKTSALVSDKEIDEIDAFSPLAPLHNPGAVQVLRAFRKLAPDAKNVAVFDTSYHQTMEPEYYLYPVPREWYKKHSVRRYGMHGTSHKYIMELSRKTLKKDKVNIISCHIGNGASLAAIKDNKCINTSMGLTPLPGVMMGSRSGDVDPAIVEYMVNETNKSVGDITNALNKESGLLGLSKISSDMRDVTKAAAEGNKDAEEALEIYARKIANYIVQYQNDLENKVDAIVFTAGVGENSANTRSMVIKKIKTMKLELDKIVNETRSKDDVVLLSTPSSEVKVYMMKTNEELMIVKDLIEYAKI